MRGQGHHRVWRLKFRRGLPMRLSGNRHDTMTTAASKTARPPGLWRRLASWLDGSAGWPPEVRQAHELVRAVDAGGVPLNPAKVNQIGRALGLEVSARAPVEETIERIRQALTRVG